MKQKCQTLSDSSFSNVKMCLILRLYIILNLKTFLSCWFGQNKTFEGITLGIIHNFLEVYRLNDSSINVKKTNKQ